MMTFLYLFLEFFKIGLFAVGGGPATIPFLQDLARSDYGSWDGHSRLSGGALNPGTSILLEKSRGKFETERRKNTVKLLRGR